MSREPGTRVMALSHSDADKNEAYSFGEGELLGNLVPGENPDIPIPVGAVAMMRDMGLPNPCIKLDSGQYIWGCECWWGPIDAVKERIDGMTIVEVDIDEKRAEVLKIDENTNCINAMCERLLSNRGPTRVMIGAMHTAIPYDRYDGQPIEVIYLRDDGWSIGATVQDEAETRDLWRDKWIAIFRRFSGENRWTYRRWDVPDAPLVEVTEETCKS